MEKAAKVVGLRDQQSDLSYWLSKTPQERLAAIEILACNMSHSMVLKPAFKEFVELFIWKGRKAPITKPLIRFLIKK